MYSMRSLDTDKQGTSLVQKVCYESDFNAHWQIQILPYMLISRRNSLNLISLNILVCCWTLFHPFPFTNCFSKCLSRAFRILTLPLFTLNECTSPYFFHWKIVLFTDLNPMVIFWDTCILSKAEVCFGGCSPTGLFNYSCLLTRREHLQ